MLRKYKLVPLVLAVILCLVGVSSVNAAPKYAPKTTKPYSAVITTDTMSSFALDLGLKIIEYEQGRVVMLPENLMLANACGEPKTIHQVNTSTKDGKLIDLSEFYRIGEPVYEGGVVYFKKIKDPAFDRELGRSLAWRPIWVTVGEYNPESR